MLFMNESDIDIAVEMVGKYRPEFLPYVKFLERWKEVVNSNTDGWPYWAGGARPAKQLMSLVHEVVANIRHSSAPLPTHPQFRKAMGPVKAAASRKGWALAEATVEGEGEV